ncbi:MAG: hypothetical protein ACK559_16475 [bacterium]
MSRQVLQLPRALVEPHGVRQRQVGVQGRQRQLFTAAQLTLHGQRFAVFFILRIFRRRRREGGLNGRRRR